MVALLEPASFVDDPLASDSAQFPLARPLGSPVGTEEPSPAGIRPWNLRAISEPAHRGLPLPEFHYDHDRQVAVGADGHALIEINMGEPTANSVTDGDGDEGRAEDWTYDFAPDFPLPV